MVQVLAPVPSFGEKLIDTLSNAGSQVAQGLMNRSAAQRLQGLTQRLSGQNGQSATIEDKMNQAAGQAVTPPPTINEIVGYAQDIDRVYGKSAPAVMSALVNQVKETNKDIRQEAGFKHAREEKGEPVLQELENKLESHEQEGLRFERLSNLFAPELENKFPPSFAVGLLTKDGELRPLAQSQLSPEAQEATKLIVDNIKGAKDTYGSRVTNFDAQQYLKTLPSFLNSPEGRRRVLRDLRILNKLNVMHDQGVLDIVEREGGAGKISISQAERRYKKENAGAIKELKEEFVNPEKKVFSKVPDASLYPGRSYEDTETGEKFISNGKEWIAE